MNPILSISHVSKNFGTKEVLKDVNFEVPEHTIFGFIGKNGAGKTTTMKMILGLLPIDEGQILVNGEPVSYGNTRTNRFVGYLPDVPEFYPYMTAAEYLCFCGELTGLSKAEITDRKEHLLQLVGLGDEKRRIKGFSRGMKQRLGLAQALFGKPKLLICDEPTSALDPIGRKELLDMLVAAKQETTVLFSTHILSDVEHICDEAAFLNEGKIVRSGTLHEIKKIENSAAMEIALESMEEVRRMLASFPFLKEFSGNTPEQSKGKFDDKYAGEFCLLLENQEKMPELLRYIADQKISVVRIERVEPTLEDLFIEEVSR